MRKPFAILLPIAVCSLLLVVGQAAGGTRSSSAVKTVTIVMHDPGCHWFSVGGKFKTTLSVKGPIALLNYDERALKVVGSSGTKLAPVGKKITLTRGTYRITMVRQASDDNHLKLTVT
jgi:hypothetical protein